MPREIRSVRRKLLIAAAILLAIAVVVIAAAILYLNLGDLSRHRGTVERLVSRALGRELKIAGDFAPDIGFTFHLEASQITLANPEWSTEPHMVSVDRLAGDIRLVPLLFGSYEVDNLEIEGARVLLESDGTGRANWRSDTGKKAKVKRRGALDIELRRALLQDVALFVTMPAFGRPLELRVAELTVESDESGTLQLSLAGALNEADLGLSGRLGTLGGLVEAAEVDLDLEGHFGTVAFETRGRVGNLATFAAADLEIDISGAEMSEITDLLGLPSLGDGPFRVTAVAEPAGERLSVNLDGTLGQVSIAASGVTDALFDPDILDLEVRTSGPDVSAVAALAGLPGAARKAFSVSGHVRWEGFPLTLDDVSATVGDNHIRLEGTLGAPPTLLATDFRFDADGPDISEISLLGGFGLPPERFEIHGRLVRLEGGIGIENVTATVGATFARIDGTLGDPPTYAGTKLVVEARGPDLSTYSTLANTALPALPFDCAGGFAPDGDSISLEHVTARLGPNFARVDGTVKTVAGFVGTDVRVVVDGPDLSWLEGPTGFSDLPRKPYRVEGRLGVEEAGYRLDGVKARVGEATADLDGRVGLLPDLAGTSLHVVAGGPDFSIPASLVGAAGAPPEPFRIEGGLRMANGSLELEQLQARVGEARATVTGRIAPSYDLVGTELNIDAEGPDASTLGQLLRQPYLPAAPFSVSGAVEIGETGYRLNSVVVELAGNRAAINGTLSTTETLSGTDLAIELAGPSLGEIGHLTAQSGLVTLPELPPEPFSLKGGVAIDNDGYVLRGVEGTLGTATGRVGGRLGFPPEFRGTDLTARADCPDASVFTAVTGVTVPEAPFRINGRFERLDRGFRFHDVSARLGEYKLEADGRLGELPKLVGTDFDVRAEGPSLALISKLSGLRWLPEKPFSLTGHFDGNPRLFRSDRFEIRFGESDVQGSFRVDIENRPTVQATLRSDRIDLPWLRERLEASEGDAGGGRKQPAEQRAMLITDEPLPLSVLRAVDGDATWTIRELALPLDRFRDVELDVSLHDGQLEAGPLTVIGSGGGRLEADLALEPAGDAYTLRTTLTLDDTPLRPSQVARDPTRWPSVDIQVELTATGRSAHQLASTADGRIAVVAGPGEIDSSLAELFVADILVTLLEALNPFRKENPSSELECAVLMMNLEAGVGVLDPIAIQTDKMTIVGEGRIDFSTEKIGLDWVTKPRKGLGLSATTITNPYVRLGGTLAEPHLEMKPIQGAAATGLAVATGGLSLLGKGLLDRITAEQKVCERALEEAEKQRQKKTDGG